LIRSPVNGEVRGRFAGWLLLGVGDGVAFASDRGGGCADR
jgi:hypothetical protein